MKISVLTPTADRPAAFALAEKMMARQTVIADEWIVADGGVTPVECTAGQIHCHDPRETGAANFAHNLLNGIARARGDVLVIVEDDDYYAPSHIDRMVEMAQIFPIVGAEDVQRYYNVAHRCWRTFNNIGASMCQTAIRRELWPQFAAMIRMCLERNTYGIDTNFWRSVPRENWGIVGAMTVVGIKGLPGKAGLGVGHRPDALWTADHDLAKLRSWIGSDADVYAEFEMKVAA